MEGDVATHINGEEFDGTKASFLLRQYGMMLVTLQCCIVAVLRCCSVAVLQCCSVGKTPSESLYSDNME